jgi:hypothetical protein
MFYGVSAGEAAANRALRDVRAELASFGKTSPSGYPYTFILVFREAGGIVLTSAPTGRPSANPSR